MSVASSPAGSAKAKSKGNLLAVAQWVVVLLVGLLIVALILGFNLIPRLSAGQKVLNTAKPLFQAQRLDGTAAGVQYISTDVDMANPLMTPAGGGAAEVPQLVAFLSKELKLTPAQVEAALLKNFPHTTNLLLSLPFSSASAELPKMVAFLSTALKMSPGAVEGALKTNFPHLFQVIELLPKITGEWNTATFNNMTHFAGPKAGTVVTGVPALRDYFNSEVIPALASQQGNFESLDGTSSVDWIPVFLLIVGIVVVLLSLLMIGRHAKGAHRKESIAAAALVPIVGIVAIVLAIGLQLNSRVNHGQKLLNGLKPAFQEQRVAGATNGIAAVGTILQLEDLIMTPKGGASAEVPKLVAFLSKELKLTPAQTEAALLKNFPSVTHLLLALPLTSVSAELPHLVQFLMTELKAPESTVLKALATNFPHLTQTILAAPVVTNNWNNLGGASATAAGWAGQTTLANQLKPVSGLTTFNGQAVTTAPELGNYLATDVIPVLGKEQANYSKLIKHGAITWIGIVVLSIGIVATEFGLLMLWSATKFKYPKDGDPKAPKGAKAPKDPKTGKTSKLKGVEGMAGKLKDGVESGVSKVKDEAQSGVSKVKDEVESKLPKHGESAPKATEPSAPAVSDAPKVSEPTVSEPSVSEPSVSDPTLTDPAPGTGEEPTV